MSDELHKPGDWMKVLRRIRFAGTRDGVRGATIKGVATMLASYADYKDGTRVFPGTARVAVDCEIDYRTAKRCIAVLRDLGLILLVRKAEHRGQADEYRLDLPEDLLDRDEIEVWDPDRHESEISRLREKHRGTYKPKDSADDLRGTQGTAETGSADPVPVDSAVPAGDRRRGSAVPAVPDLRGTPCPPTYQSTDHGSDQPYSEDLSEDAEGPRESIHGPLAVVIPIMPKRGPCPHGNSPKRRRDGQPRCDECRNQADVSDPLPDLGASKCVHGLKVALDSDGRPRCFACRRGLPGAI